MQLSKIVFLMFITNLSTNVLGFSKMCGNLEVTLETLLLPDDPNYDRYRINSIEYCIEKTSKENLAKFITPNFSFFVKYDPYKGIFETDSSAVIELRSSWQYRLSQILSKNASLLNITHISDIVIPQIPETIKFFYSKYRPIAGEILPANRGGIEIYKKGPITERPKWQNKIHINAIAISEFADYEFEVNF